MVEFEQGTRKEDQNTIYVKYSSHFTGNISATINHRTYGDYQLVICYNGMWLKEAYFNTLDAVKQYVKETEQTIRNIDREIWKKIFAVECQMVEEYKDTF